MTSLSLNMVVQEYNHFIHHSEQLQLADDRKVFSVRTISDTFTNVPVLLTSGFCLFVEEFTPVVSRLKQSLWSGHGKYLNLLFLVG